MASADPAHVRAEAELRKQALAYPETHEDFPWGHRALKVKNKAFVFMVCDATGLSLSCKLPHSGAAAITLPFAQPTGYGLGKSGWVSAQFAPGTRPPTKLLSQWLEESYRAVAPKRLVSSIWPSQGSAPSRRSPARASPKPSRPAAKRRRTSSRTKPK